MQRRSVRARLFVSVALVSVAGCDTIKIDHHAALEARATKLAEGFCAAYQDCDCGPLATDALHPDPEQCVSEQKARILAAFEQAEDHGLDFDHSCMNQLLSRYQELGCESLEAVHIELGNPALFENFGCALYHGDQTDGICERTPGTSWSDCAAGRMCGDDNHCGPVMASASAGQACAVNYSEFSLDCDAGLYCADQTATCEPFIGAGEPCTLVGVGLTRCAPDHHCELLSEDSFDGTCQPLKAAGEPCNPMTDSLCLGWCVELEGSDDPTVGACIDVPAVCLYEGLQPPA